MLLDYVREWDEEHLQARRSSRLPKYFAFDVETSGSKKGCKAFECICSWAVKALSLFSFFFSCAQSKIVICFPHSNNRSASWVSLFATRRLCDLPLGSCARDTLCTTSKTKSLSILSLCFLLMSVSLLCALCFSTQSRRRSPIPRSVHYPHGRDAE